MSQGPLLQPGSCGHLRLCPHCLLFGVLLLPYLGQWCWYRPSRVQNILNGNWGPQAVMTGKKGHCSGKKPNNHWKTDKRETQASDSNDSGSSHSEATLPFLWCLSEVPFLLSQQIGVKFVLLETSHNWKQGRRFWEWHLESLLLTSDFGQTSDLLSFFFGIMENLLFTSEGEVEFPKYHLREASHAVLLIAY